MTGSALLKFLCGFVFEWCTESSLFGFYYDIIMPVYKQFHRYSRNRPFKVLLLYLALLALNIYCN